MARLLTARLLALCGALLLTTVGLAPAHAAPVVGDTPSAAWKVDGRVYATRIIGNTVVVGGQFTTATSTTGERVARKNLAAFRLDTGELIRTWRADAGGTVRAIEPAGAWVYVGGAFERVGGVLVKGLGKVRVADGQVDPSFSGDLDAPVRALDHTEGGLYVGGAFTTVGGTPRAKLARLNPLTGELDRSFTPAVNNDVWGVVKNPVSDVVYLSGDFSGAGGSSRTGVAAVSSVNGALRSTIFTGAARPTLGLDINDAGTRLFGAGGAKTNLLTAWNASTGALVWSHEMMGDVQAVTHYEGKVYFGFHEGYAGDTQRKVMAADESTGVIDTLFQPRVDSFWGVFAVDASDAGVVAGGDFTLVSGVGAQGWTRFLATGVTAPPPPPTNVQTTYLSGQATWRYWDRGAAATGWQTNAFSDASWSVGTGHFGYGDGDETTLLGWGPSTTSRHRTSYYRTTFSVAQVPDRVTLELVADDGAVVHVNGVEVVRDNMPAGPVVFSTKAASNRSGAAENVAREFTIPASALRVGANVIAVEVHQDASSSSDLSFAASLVGVRN
ncbi:delta-60 repeat domain-containing protein [Nocardioides gilvus]|uniref:delta-60 repeat domain-containing protein n=1 Tax=Nocardioides gilvus TaxID=1735589 RepID=UPI000D7504E9|nr:delta-60 repeat domain-containing protein [Nocardioides gilvus]